MLARRIWGASGLDRGAGPVVLQSAAKAPITHLQWRVVAILFLVYLTY
jgi:hypothetical protein